MAYVKPVSHAGRVRGAVLFAIVAALIAGAVDGPGGAHAAASPGFADVSAVPGSPDYSEFATEISWLTSEGVATGWVEDDGTTTFRPFEPVTRDAMAAFLYRYAGSPTVSDADSVTPFADVPADSEFIREIAWLASTGISSGWVAEDGSREFRPFAPITRDAMAAFLFRFARGAVAPTVAGSFADVSPQTSQFSGEIEWLASQGITAGYDRAGGLTDYRPFANITRDAMAAFLYRYDRGGLAQFTAPTPVVSGTVSVRQTVRAAPGVWTPTPTTVSYQWLRDGVAIAGATSPDYALGAQDAGRTLSVRVVGERAGYLRLARQSEAVSVPNDVGGALLAGESMSAGTVLRSPTGAAEATVRPDGDLQVSLAGSVSWRSQTVGSESTTLALDSNGVLSLLRGDGSVAWSSTPIGGSQARLSLSDDGRLEIRLGNGSVSWSSAVQGSVRFDFPFEAGQRWAVGGPHGGLGSASWNSIDFGPSSSRPSSPRVVAIAAGTVKWLSCGSRGYLAVDHDGGWQSGYYHMTNVQTQLIGTRVEKGTYLGDVGSELPCGGSSTFDHVHLQITYRGVTVPMNGFTIGGYTVYSSGTAYYGYWRDAAGRTVLTAPGGARCCLAATPTAP